ncbi:MAG TPA: hypothetical protein VGJ05_03365 [Fimbriiglobus sp.]|jgi:hypothetical protein
MKSSRGIALAVLAGSLAGLAGCDSGPKYVRVSGIVRINGVPYDKAVVSFQPMGTKENWSPGRGSSSYTDANGRFDLICDMERQGAVVGRHRVRIMTRGNNVIGYDPVLGSPDKPPAFGRGLVFDPIPPEWNALSQVEFVVPAEGTDQANFDIVSKFAKRK